MIGCLGGFGINSPVSGIIVPVTCIRDVRNKNAESSVIGR